MQKLFTVLSWGAVIGLVGIVAVLLVWIFVETRETDGIEVEKVLDEGIDELEHTEGTNDGE